MQWLQWLASPKNPTLSDAVYGALGAMRDPWYLGSKSALRAPYKASKAVCFSAVPRTGSRHAPRRPGHRARTCRSHAGGRVSFDTIVGRIADVPGFQTKGTSLVPHERSINSRTPPTVSWPICSRLRAYVGSPARRPRTQHTGSGRGGTGQARRGRATSRGLPCLLDLRRTAARSSIRRREDPLSRDESFSCSCTFAFIRGSLSRCLRLAALGVYFFLRAL